MEMRVDAPGFRDDVVRQGIEIGGLELRGFSPSQHIGDDWVLALQCGEGLLVRLVLAGFGLLRFISQIELIKKDFT